MGKVRDEVIRIINSNFYRIKVNGEELIKKNNRELLHFLFLIEPDEDIYVYSLEKRIGIYGTEAVYKGYRGDVYNYIINSYSPHTLISNKLCNDNYLNGLREELSSEYLVGIEDTLEKMLGSADEIPYLNYEEERSDIIDIRRLLPFSRKKYMLKVIYDTLI